MVKLAVDSTGASVALSKAVAMDFDLDCGRENGDDT